MMSKSIKCWFYKALFSLKFRVSTTRINLFEVERLSGCKINYVPQSQGTVHIIAFIVLFI